MRKLAFLLLVFTFFVADSSAQFKEQSLKFDELKLSNQSAPKYFDVNHRFIFEYGLIINLTREQPVVSTGSATYEFNLILKRLYGSVQLGAFVAHGEEKAGVGGLLGFGLDCNVLTEDKYNLSVYLGLMGVFAGWPGVFAVAHVRNSFVTDDIGAFTIGLRYLTQGRKTEHWLMPTVGYQLWLK